MGTPPQSPTLTSMPIFFPTQLRSLTICSLLLLFSFLSLPHHHQRLLKASSNKVPKKTIIIKKPSTTMDAIKGGPVFGGGGGGRVGVGVGVEEDMGDGMQCSDHPYRNNPGGICAFCLQEKLGKLVSSSFPIPIRGSSSSSSSPSFRSDIGTSVGHVGTTNVHASSATSLSLSVRPTSTKVGNDGGNMSHYRENYTRKARIPFLLAKKKKKIMVSSSSSSDRDIVFKRSKSTATSSTRRTHFLDSATDDGCEEFSPRKRGGFWSFLYLSSSSSSSNKSSNTSTTTATTVRRPDSRMSSLAVTPTATTTNGSLVKPKEKCLGSSLSRKNDISVVVEEDDSANTQATASASSFERKVSRSRSVGCGSRSFSGDFFERISTGFGDCTLRRVESQREGKTKVNPAMKERVKCGGIFGGFIITSSSSSSSSSSYWVSSSGDHDHHMNGKPTAGVGAGPLAHGRTRSWSWAFASPMRAFSKPSSKDGKRERDIMRQASSKNTTPNLSAIPSLLAVRG